MTSRAKDADELTERKLINGWAAAPRVRVRQARVADLDAIAELIPLTGVALQDELAQTVRDGTASVGLRAGLRGDGRQSFTTDMAKRFVHQSEDEADPIVAATLVLVAEHRDHGVVGTLVAYPPVNVATQMAQQLPNLAERQNLVAAATMFIVKIKALAVAEQARGHNIGGSLLKRCRQVFTHCGYVLTYGQMPPGRGLGAYYQRQGFTVLPVGAGIDTWPIFGIQSRIMPDHGEQIFCRDRLHSSH
jgi:N-acetylglutamate synthase-like GNAT family acetyltransferase